MTDQPTLFYTKRSPYARKVELVLASLGISVKKEEVEFENPSQEFVQTSFPTLRVPSLATRVRGSPNGATGEGTWANPWSRTCRSQLLILQ